MKKKLWLVLIICCSLVLFGIRFFSPGEKDNTQSPLLYNSFSMKISADFIDNSLMSSQYTCDDEGRFPNLTIENIPLHTKNLVLIVDDPDASGGVRNHLLLANIPLSENHPLIISQDTFDQGVFGQNSRSEQAWGAPCPPSGTHRYIFKIYALSEKLEISSGFSKERLIELMGGKILDQSQIVGLYKRY